MPRFISTFLSHSSEDKPLVRKVARELARRGVIPWLDEHRLLLGYLIDHTLTEAIKREKTVVAFLSRASVVSDWVERELAQALALEQNYSDGRTAVLPIFLGDRHQLVSAARKLLRDWFHPQTREEDSVGFDCDPNAGDEENARRIADAVAKRLFEDASVRTARGLIVYCDQRTGGNRAEEPELPEELAGLDAPCLVFRSDMGPGSKSETLVGEEWREFARAVVNALNVALNGTGWTDRKRIHLHGTGQLALAFELGRHFDYNTAADLICYGRPPRGRPGRDIFSITGEMPSGNCDGEVADDPRFPVPAAPAAEMAIALVAQKVHGQAIASYLDHHHPQMPRVRLSHADPLLSSKAVMQLIADVTAVLTKYREQGTQRFLLFTTLPFHALPLLAAMLRHCGKITFAEYRTDLSDRTAENAYAELP